MPRNRRAYRRLIFRSSRSPTVVPKAYATPIAFHTSRPELRTSVLGHNPKERHAAIAPQRILHALSSKEKDQK